MHQRFKSVHPGSGADWGRPPGIRSFNRNSVDFWQEVEALHEDSIKLHLHEFASCGGKMWDLDWSGRQENLAYIGWEMRMMDSKSSELIASLVIYT